jgi:hypothetical protein
MLKRGKKSVEKLGKLLNNRGECYVKKANDHQNFMWKTYVKMRKTMCKKSKNVRQNKKSRHIGDL